MAQGSAGEVIKENGSLGGWGGNPQWISFPYWKQVTRGHAHKHMRTHRDTNTHPHRHTGKAANAHAQKGVREERQLVSSNHSL